MQVLPKPMAIKSCQERTEKKTSKTRIRNIVHCSLVKSVQKEAQNSTKMFDIKAMLTQALNRVNAKNAKASR